ncbi:MAG: extracellular solute-binding protein [Fimbriimonadaceae bacterium]|nr:extracellular solute-binding protein [Fimbriimonadaceae bacterium]QYK57980.1 MAG: extracellular solute-binding protein [Fimbriimonadaceae bacterium]
MSARLFPALLLALLLAGASRGQTVIRMMAGPSFGIPPKESTGPRDATRRAVFDEFHRQNPDVRVVNAGGLEMTGDRAESNFLMSMAGDTAPDVFYVNFRQYFNYVDQGFCRPLDDLVARWPGSTDRVHPEVMKVLQSLDGRLYAMPFFQVAQALYYRKDHFAEAGLDPEKPPTDWKSFLESGRRLTESASGRQGFVFPGGPGGKAYWWTNFVWQAGGEVLVPAERGLSRSVVASPEAAKALDFFRVLTLETWQGRDGKTYGPVALISAQHAQDIREGKVSMWFAYTNDVMLSISDIHPSLIGVAALPAGPAGRANEINAGMWAINSAVSDPKKLDACWRFIEYFVSQEAAKVQTNKLVELGLGTLVDPRLLVKFGHPELAAQVDPAYVEANQSLFTTGRPEPYGRNSQQVYVVLDAALDRARLENTPSEKILEDVQQEMNQKLLGYTPPEDLRARRTVAGWIFGLLGVGLAAYGAMSAARVWGKNSSVEASERRLSQKRRFFWMCLGPAVLTIFVWAYYPLLRGLVIAFQDYRIVKPAVFVGADNFIEVFTQPVFYKALLNSSLYVSLTIMIGFLIPVVLAIALNEIPKGTVFLRTVFYLPAMTSGVVIALMWRQFYDRSSEGLLNTLVAPFVPFVNPFLAIFHGPRLTEANDWLGNPQLALLAVVLPGVWAGAGPGSILYLAALKNIPEERYEAADLDGANWWTKLLRVTLPGLRVLMGINLLGVFIGGFKAMENVFVLTGGGPLYATHTIGLEVWQNAFMFLKFGYATAAAWVMGAILIGFTVLQIRSLTKVKFTAGRAEHV